MIQLPLPSLSSRQLSLLTAVYLLLQENRAFWKSFLGLVNLDTTSGMLATAALFTALAGIFFIVLLLFSMRWLQKPLLSVLILVAAAVSYFQIHFGVIVDTSMIQNIVETDQREAAELITAGYIGHMALYGLLPVIFLWLIPVRRQTWGRELVRGGVWGVVAVLLVGVALWGGYKDLSLIGRENRELRYLLNPSFPINSAVKYLRSRFKTPDAPPAPIATDSKRSPDDADPHIMVLVLGETARVANFSLAGYARETNPELKKQNILFYPNVSSCGTATAESVPCLFAHLTREQFSVDKAHTYENILDVLKGTGVKVTWIDNNSGCKGVCDRVETINAAASTDQDLCSTGECFDEILVRYLDQVLASGISGDRLIVLHQKGSHGPAYYKRYPRSFARFQPECASAAPQECSVEEIVNAYDNTILYTDHVLSLVIDRLKAIQGAEASMIYVSDHGESLGENGIYLHGLPYFIAPKEQTHVPMLLWMSNGFARNDFVDTACMQANLTKQHSHDEIFHTLLRMFEVKTELFEPGLDLFGNCMTAH